MSENNNAPGPLAVDLGVMKLGGETDPVTREDVERALYALTGWSKPQTLVDTALLVVDRYAWGAEVGALAELPVRPASGHSLPSGTSVPCEPVSVQPQAQTRGNPSVVVAVMVMKHGSEADPADRVTTLVDTVQGAAPLPSKPVPPKPAPAKKPAPVKQGAAKPKVKPVATESSRRGSGPTVTPKELVWMSVAGVEKLTDAQRAARTVLLTGTQRCSKCSADKSLDSFHRDKGRLTGHASTCKSCSNEADAARRAGKRSM